MRKRKFRSKRKSVYLEGLTCSGPVLFAQQPGRGRTKKSKRAWERDEEPTTERYQEPIIHTSEYEYWEASSPSWPSPSHKDGGLSMSLGDHIAVYAGNDLIGEGSYIDSNETILVWVNAVGDVTFTFLGGRISIEKV